jgi:hypothetical protein
MAAPLCSKLKKEKMFSTLNLLVDYSFAEKIPNENSLQKRRFLVLWLNNTEIMLIMTVVTLCALWLRYQLLKSLS